MKFDRFAGTLAASFICLTLAIVAWTGVAGPIWRAHYTAKPDEWLGFAGSILGALATLLAASLAAGGALYAAVKTLSPMRDQLNQLIKQNDHILYEKFRQRALDLNNEIILLQKVCTGCKLVDQTLSEFLRETGINLNRTGFIQAVKSFTDDLEPLRVIRGAIWGDSRIQIERNTFVDTVLSAATLALSFEDIADKQRHVAEMIIKRDMQRWNDLNRLTDVLGNQLRISADLELMRVGQVLSELEEKLFV